MTRANEGSSEALRGSLLPVSLCGTLLHAGVTATRPQPKQRAIFHTEAQSPQDCQPTDTKRNGFHQKRHPVLFGCRLAVQRRRRGAAIVSSWRPRRGRKENSHFSFWLRLARRGDRNRLTDHRGIIGTGLAGRAVGVFRELKGAS